MQRSSCVRIIHAGRVLAVERKDGRGWCLPGGKSEEDELSVEAALRELREEAGIHLVRDQIQLSHRGAYEGPSGEREVTMYDARDLSPWMLVRAVSPEGLRMEWFRWEFFRGMSPFSAFYEQCPAP